MKEKEGILTIKKHLNSLDLYYQEVFYYPKVNQDQIKHLLSKIKGGDEEAYNYFYMTQQRLVIHIANKFSYIKGLDKMDLIQEGNFGLTDAIESYDETKGIKFSSYAFPIIYSKIIDALNDQADIIKVSSYIKQKDKQHPKAYLSVDNNYSVLSDEINSDYPKANSSSPMKAYLSQEQKNIIEQSLNKLDPKSKKMVSMYFGLNGFEHRTYEELGDLFNMSKVGAYKYIKRQLNKLKDIKDY